MKDKLNNKSLRDFENSLDRRLFLEEQLDVNLTALANFSFEEQKVSGRNIENLIGGVSIPLGVAGPLLVNGVDYFAPVATTEGALVASINRGAKAVTLSGGVKAFDELIGMTRGPVFKVKNIEEAIKVKKWIGRNFKLLKSLAEKTSNHIELLKIDFANSGKNLFIRFYFDCQEAMGMNMATFATAAIVKKIEEETKAKCIALAGNYDTDKKSSWLNFISGRGRRVWADLVIKKDVVKSILKTEPENIVDVVQRKCLLGSILSGSMGYNSHFGNIVAALYLATGQDPAHVTEGSLGVTFAELEENGDLYFSVYLPAVEIGVIGGGTILPSQKEALSILKLKKGVKEFSHVLGGMVLAGELSLIASLAEDSLVCAHQTLGRGSK